MEHGDYIIYGDESGDHSMADGYKDYPAFVLALCVFSKNTYISDVVTSIKSFKFAFWGHGLVILHSSKLRKRKEDFQFLHDRELRTSFLNALNDTIAKSPFEIISMAIDKRLLKEADSRINPYELTLELCIEKIYQFLEEKEQHRKLTHVVIESRGKKEDDELQTAFRKIITIRSPLQEVFPLKLMFVDKKSNCAGLQIADLVAYPIGRYLIDPEKENPAFKIVEKKILLYPEYRGTGLMMFPFNEAAEKRKTPDFSEV
jgi:hypothetical protein